MFLYFLFCPYPPPFSSRMAFNGMASPGAKSGRQHEATDARRQRQTPARPHRIDDKLDRLMARVAELQVDAELRDLEKQMPISPVARMAHPRRPPPRWSERATQSAAQAAAEAAAQRAVAAEAESQQRAAAAQTAATAAAAAEVAAAAALEEAHMASSAAAVAARPVGTRRRPPPPPGSSTGEPATAVLKRHMEGGDWVCAARVAVAKRSASGLSVAPQLGSPGLPERTRGCWVGLLTQERSGRAA